MFDAIGNMPLHPLVIHAVVIGIPLTLLLALLFVFPRTRSWARWPLAVTAVGSLVVTFVARASGPGLRKALGIEPGNPTGDLIAEHAQLAGQLMLIMVVLVVVTLLNVFLVRSPVSRDSGAARRGGAVAVVLPVLLVVVALAAGIWVFRVGDLGARAVWNPTGTPEFTITVGR